ncbi:MAG: septum formation protein Maf [Clostridia bacterium]|nr:septum formation protein Maf [Clostridia bacterium]
MNKIQFILASASPRRSELLKKAGFVFAVAASGAKETGSGTAGEAALANAQAKCLEVASRPENKGFAVIGADTVVCVGDEILGKPKDASDAKRMLLSLSGTTHRVMTGYYLKFPDGSAASGICTTFVAFRKLSESEIDGYIATGEPFDKAGAYGIQEKGGAFVQSAEGDIDNVIGLPTGEITAILAEHGIFPRRD